MINPMLAYEKWVLNPNFIQEIEQDFNKPLKNLA
jgi:hypothetical protein